jgi:glycine cleavage system transcriptional repressor
MASLALAALGRDRPGIVASVSRALFELGCNVEDSSMTLLRGNFAMMLVFACPDEVTASSATEALRPACESMGLTYSVLEVDDRATFPDPTHVLTVYGADRPGILFKTCEALAGTGVNITDLNSRLVGESDPVYAVTLEIELPDGTDASDLERSLQALATQIGVDLVLNERDTDVL